MTKYFFVAGSFIIIVGTIFYGAAHAATINQPSIIPQVNDTFDLGTSSPLRYWNGLYAKTICLEGDVCRTTWPTGGAGGGGGGWTFIKGGIYNSTTTDQVFIGETSTTTTAKLEVKGGIAATSPTATSTLAGPVQIKGSGLVTTPILFVGTSTTGLPLYGSVQGDSIVAEMDFNGIASIEVVNANSGNCAASGVWADGNIPAVANNFAFFGFLNTGWVGSGCGAGNGLEHPLDTLFYSPTGSEVHEIASTSPSVAYQWYTNNTTLAMTLNNGTGLLTPFFGFLSQASSTVTGKFTAINASTTNATVLSNEWHPGLTASKLLALDQNGMMISSSTIGNGQLQNSSIVVTTAAPLGGAATVPLGGTLALTCATCATALFDVFTHPNTTSSATTSLVLLNGNASTTMFSDFTTAFIGGTATTTIAGNNATSSFASNITIGTTTDVGGASGAQQGALTISNILTKGAGLIINTWVNVVNAFRIFKADGSIALNIDTTATVAGWGVATSSPWATLAAVGDGTNPIFAVSTSTTGGASSTQPIFMVDSNYHLLTGGPQPTFAACGSAPTITGNDNVMVINTGTAGLTECVVNFAKTWNLPPVCTPEEEGSTATVTLIASSSVTQLRVGLSASLTGATIGVQCMGLQ